MLIAPKNPFGLSGVEGTLPTATNEELKVRFRGIKKKKKRFRGFNCHFAFQIYRGYIYHQLQKLGYKKPQISPPKFLRGRTLDETRNKNKRSILSPQNTLVTFDCSTNLPISHFLSMFLLLMSLHDPYRLLGFLDYS